MKRIIFGLLAGIVLGLVAGCATSDLTAEQIHDLFPEHGGGYLHATNSAAVTP